MTTQFVGLDGCCFRIRCRHIVVRLKSAKCTLRHLDPNCCPPLPTAHHLAYKMLAQTATDTTTARTTTTTTTGTITTGPRAARGVATDSSAERTTARSSTRLVHPQASLLGRTVVRVSFAAHPLPLLDFESNAQCSWFGLNKHFRTP